MKIHTKYKPLSNKTRYFIITGGRGSAKSFSTNVFLTLLTYEKGHRILFTRYTMTAANKSIIPELMEKIDLMGCHKDFQINRTDITNIQTGSQVIFSGIKTSSGNQTANLKSLQGVTTWVLDEAEEMDDEETFDTIDLSVRSQKTQNRVILIMNPATKEHWIYKRFFERAGVEPGFNGIKGDITYIHTTYLDNLENLPDSYLRQIQHIKETNPRKYEHKILGGWKDREDGVVFENWEYGQFDESLPYLYGQDFGYSIDPTVLVKVAIDEKRKVIYMKECYGRPGMSTDEIAFHNLEHAGNNLIVADSAEPRLIAELKNKGCNMVAAIKGPDSIRAGIMRMMDYKLMVDPDSTEIGKEFNNYVWDDKKSNKPVDDYNHRVDAIRYVVMRQTRKRRFVAV